jgi:hypothetical protein
MAEKTGMRAAKATPADVDQMREFLFELEQMVNDAEYDLHDIGTFCHARFNSDCGRHFQRVLFGYDTLIENACDPTLSYLDWKPEIKEAITAFQHRVHADEKPAAVKAAFSAQNILSRLFGWFSAFRR